MTAESVTAAGNAQLARVLSICLTCILVAVIPGAALLQRGTGAFVFVGAPDHVVHLGRRSIQPVPPGGVAAPRPPPPTCNLKINESAFAGSCTLLQDVCVDQVGSDWAYQMLHDDRISGCLPARPPALRRPLLPAHHSSVHPACASATATALPQGKVILYSPKHIPRRNGRPEDLPLLEPTNRQSHYYLIYRGKVRHQQEL